MSLEYAKNATVAKTRAIYGKRLKTEDYHQLMTRQSVSDAADFLKRNTHFAEALSNIDTGKVHRGFLESLLLRAYYDQYEKICKFQQLNTEPFYNYLLIRYEISELLKAILYLNSKRQDNYIESMHTYFMEKSSFDLIALAKARNFQELLKVLYHTPYYDILKNIKLNKDGTVDYTLCEIKLRIYYYKWLIDTVKVNFKGESKKVLQQQIQVQIDLINIINAYRMKKFFNADAQALKNNVLPFHGRLSKRRQNELFETKSPEEFLRVLSDTIYGKQMENLDENMNSEIFERELGKLRCDLAKRSLMFSENAAVSLYSLMFLSEIELNNIIHIIESIRYNKSIEYMENLIIV